MESVSSSLKTERMARKVYRTLDEARADIFDYMGCFYNPRRRHSKLGYLTHGVRGQRYASLTCCPRNRRQLNLRNLDPLWITGVVDANERKRKGDLVEVLPKNNYMTVH